MELVLATHGLAGLGGSESYLITVAEQLERLGHGVTLLATELGRSAEVARGRGLRVTDDADELPAELDAALVQDGPSALSLAEARPGLPQVFVAHAPGIDFQLPPLVAGVTSAVVAMNDRVRERIEALPLGADVVRLRQPIDVKRFRPSPVALPDCPRRALILSNYLAGERAAAVESACRELGIECATAGRNGAPTDRPEVAIAAADVVIGYGRSVLEGMACGKAALVFDWFGGDGWVTADTYPAIEEDGFAGGATDAVGGGVLIAERLAAYEPGMGVVGRELVTKHHSAQRHAIALVELLRAAAGGEAGILEPPVEGARLARTLQRRENRVLELELESDGLRTLAAARQERIDELERERWRRPAARLRRVVARLAGAFTRDPSK